MARPIDDDMPDPGDDDRVTARPTASARRDLGEADDEKVVPIENVGGAAPTPLGLDSGGNFPGSEDDLANLAEPEPPEPPELDAVRVTRGDPGTTGAKRE